MKKTLPATILVILSFILLIPGITFKMFSMKLDAQIASSLGVFELSGVEKAYSILGTVDDLWSRDKVIVALLIFLFSIVFPATKMILYFIMLNFEKYRPKIYVLLSHLAKWSMADVFVVGILLTYMATGRETQHIGSHQLNIMGMNIGIDLKLKMASQLMQGYYYFLASCLLSIMSLTIFPLNKLKAPQSID